MRSVGRGAVYTRTSGGVLLRRSTEATELQLIQRFFEPYAQSMEELVAERLRDVGRAVIIDVHSYPSSPMAYRAPRRPDPSAALPRRGCLPQSGNPGRGGPQSLRWPPRETRREPAVRRCVCPAAMVREGAASRGDHAGGSPRRLYERGSGALISLGQVTAGYVSLIDSVA